MKEIEYDKLEIIKSELYSNVTEWVGFDIPSQGTDDYDMWQSMLLDIEDIKTIQDVVNYLECNGRDVVEFLAEADVLLDVSCYIH